ncbi:MAG: putative Ig domain-containing protein [Thermoanaerobaculia bacterium]|nr:putative Ig domain-containing protein [Thermoanaerobaculia bacterium]
MIRGRCSVLFTLALALLALPRPLLGAAVGEALVTVSPCRAVDTRSPAAPLGGPALAANQTRIFTLTGTCGVPPNALGLVVNLTVVAPAAAGYSQLYAGDAAAPPTQVLSFSAGQTRASNALVALASASGTVALANVSGGAADYLIDISGYFVTACVDTITVTNPATATGTINVPFSQTFTQTGGTGTTTFSTASPLPAGLTLATNGVLSGTPTEPGNFPITVTATDANGCTGTGPTYTLVIACQTISVTNPATTTGTANAPFSQTFTQTGGVGTTTFSTSSPLPIGLTLAANGLLSGTPTQAGGFPIVVVATDANGCTGAGATYNLVINCQTISVTNPAVTGGTAGQAFSQTFTQAGAIGSATFTTASTLPAGLSLATNGVLSGTPTQTGTFPIVVTVTDGNLCTGTSATYNLVIGCQTIAVTNPSTTAGTIGTAFSQTFTQSGSIGSATFTTSSTLPTGLTLATNGALSGTPAQTGTFPIVVTVTDANGCTGTGATYTLVISCQSFTVNPTTLPHGTTGVAYPSVTFTHTGGIGSVTFALTGALPNGMNFTPGTATLDGLPTQSGSFPVTVTATDANGCTASREYLLVVACSGTSITLSPSSLPTVLAGVAFPSTTFTASGGTGPYTFAKAGALPTGMNFTGATLDGTPTQTGTFPITISATDTVGGCAGGQDYVITVTCLGVTITVAPASLSSGNVGTLYPAVTFTATGGAGTYTFAETGALPTGMSFTVDTLSGTPTQGGTFPITVTATDVAGCSGATAYSLVIVCPTITVTNPSTTTGTVDAAFSQTFTQTGAAGTATFTTTSTLPTGLTLATDGTLSGTPGQNGTFPITVKVTDSNGCTGTGSTYTLVIACQTITVTNPGVATGTVDAAFTQTFTQSGVGTHTPATFTTASTLPSGLTLSTAGVLSGTPGQPGTFPIVVTVTDANGCTGTSSTYNLVIACQTITVTNPAVTAGTYNTAFSQTFTQTGVGTHTPATFTTASTLPTGLSLSTAGVLSGTPLQTGAFPIVVTVTDANGCTGTSATYTLSIGPKLTAKAYTDVGNTQLAGGVAAPSTPSVSVVAVSSGDTSDAAITYAVTVGPTNGALTTFNSTGTFLYTPNAGNTTSDAFTYTGTSNGVAATQTATIAFSGLVWYVKGNGSGAASGDGRSQNPFNLVASAGTASSAGHYIFVHSPGSFPASDAIALKTNQTLWGQGTDFTALSGSGLTITATSKPTLTGTVTLNTGVTVSSLDITTNPGSQTGINDPVAAITGVTIKNSVAVTTTTGTAVLLSSVDSTTSDPDGQPGINFRSVSANGGANGISLTNVNVANGTFSILGDGTNTSRGGNATGGTIQNMAGENGATAGNGIYLDTAKKVSLKRMQLNGFDNSAIRGFNVTDFTLQYATINGTSGNSTGATEGAVTFGTISGTNGLSGGTNLIDNCNVSGAVEHNLEFYNYQAGSNYSLTVSNSDIKSNSVAGGSDGFQMELGGSYVNTATVSIQSCFFDDNKSQGVQATALGSSNLDITINQCTLVRTTQGNEGFLVSNGANGHATVHMTNNTLSGIGGTALYVGQVAGNASSSSNLTAVIQGNTVTHGTAATNHSIIAFLTSTVGQSAPANLLIDGNVVTQNSTSGTVRGILVDTPDSSTTPSFTATITNNSVAVGDNVAGVAGLVAQSRRAGACFDIRNNVVTFPNGNPGVFGLRLRQVAPGTANLEQGSALLSDPASTVLQTNNSGSGTTTEVLGTVTVVNNSGCAAPPS